MIRIPLIFETGHEMAEAKTEKWRQTEIIGIPWFCEERGVLNKKINKINLGDSYVV